MSIPARLNALALRRLALAVVAPALALLAACSHGPYGFTDTVRQSQSRIAYSASRIFDDRGDVCHKESREFAPPQSDLALLAGTAVDIQNHRGAVTLRCNEHAKRITVRATYRVKGDLYHKDKKTILDAMSFDAELVESDGPPVLVIRGDSRRPDAADHWLDLHITMPSCTGVQITNRGGDVVVVGAGALHIENIAGPIEVRTDERITAPVALTTSTGNIYFQAPYRSTGRFDLRTGDGEVKFDSLEKNTLMEDMQAKRDSFAVTFNRGENPVLIRTGDGDINVAMLEDPEGRIRASFLR